MLGASNVAHYDPVIMTQGGPVLVYSGQLADGLTCVYIRGLQEEPRTLGPAGIGKNTYTGELGVSYVLPTDMQGNRETSENAAATYEAVAQVMEDYLHKLVSDVPAQWPMGYEIPPATLQLVVVEGARRYAVVGTLEPILLKGSEVRA